MICRYAATPQVTALPLWPLIAPWRVRAGQRWSRRRNRGCGLFPPIARIRLIVAMAAGTKERAHYYQDCGDPHCMMFGCRAYKTGWRDGYDKGWDEGYAQGWADYEPKIEYVYVTVSTSS